MKALDRYDDIVTALAQLTSGPVFADTETTGLNPRRDTLVLVQLYQPSLAEPILIDWRKAWPSWADALSNALSHCCSSRTTPNLTWRYYEQTVSGSEKSSAPR